MARKRIPKGPTACRTCCGTGTVESTSGKTFVCGHCNGTGLAA